MHRNSVKITNNLFNKPNDSIVSEKNLKKNTK